MSKLFKVILVTYMIAIVLSGCNGKIETNIIPTSTHEIITTIEPTALPTPIQTPVQEKVIKKQVVQPQVKADPIPVVKATSVPKIDPVVSFKAYIQKSYGNYLASDKKEYVHQILDGWSKTFSFVLLDYNSIDVVETTSLISPYKATCGYTVDISETPSYATEEEAKNSTTIAEFLNRKTHNHIYGFQDGKWTFISGEYYSESTGLWYDCRGIDGISCLYLN